MKFSKFKYSFSQAKKNIFRNGLMTVASLFTITCCLLILGFFIALSFNMNYITDQIKSQCEIQVYIKDGTSEERIEEIGDEIKEIANIKEVILFSREEAFNYYIVEDLFHGNQDLVAGLDKDTFRDSYKIKVTNIEETEITVSALEKISDVDDVKNRQDLVNTIISFSDVIKKLSILIMILLLIVAIVIMSNTIRLTVFNRRKEINIMKYIGATDRFIKVPFVIEGMMIGCIGAVIAFGFMSLGYIALSDYIIKTLSLFKLVPYYQVAPFMGVLFILTGSLIGMIGSLISMRKYLNV